MIAVMHFLVASLTMLHPGCRSHLLHWGCPDAPLVLVGPVALLEDRLLVVPASHCCIGSQNPPDDQVGLSPLLEEAAELLRHGGGDALKVGEGLR